MDPGGSFLHQPRGKAIAAVVFANAIRKSARLDSARSASQMVHRGFEVARPAKAAGIAHRPPGRFCRRQSVRVCLVPRCALWAMRRRVCPWVNSPSHE